MVGLRHIVPVLWAVLLTSAALQAQTARQVDLGARAISMGGAFVAVANDASAVSWNPAALAWLQRQEVHFTYADRFGLGLDHSYLGLATPIGDNHALGLDWFSEGFRDEDAGLGLAARLNKFGLAYAYRNGIPLLKPYIGNTAIGLSGKYIGQSLELDEQKALSVSGFGWDLGVLAPLPYGLRLGATLQDLGGTSVEHDNGLSEEVLAPHLRLGLAYRGVEGLTVAADVDDHYRLGAEYWVRGQLALRAGLKSERDTPESFGDATSTSFGLGFNYRFLRLDYAYERHPVLNATHFTSLSVVNNPRVVSIKEAIVRPNPIFRSLYRHYEENDFFDVVLSNTSQSPVEVTVALMLPKLMSVPHTEKVVLPPQSTEKYAFKVTFDQDLFNRPEAAYDNFVSPEVTVSYEVARKVQETGRQLDRVYVAGKGKLSWNVEGMAATFVTPADITVTGIARGLIQRYDEVLAAKFNRSNIGKAALLFNAMGVYKIRYQADQKTPFANISDDRTIFDTVQYPSELLELSEGTDTKIGDCDDLTVLYASMLENLSIDTAFLEANEPGAGHIYLMFDSGIRPDRAEDFFVSENEYVVWQNRVWIPVETTMYGFKFSDAWRQGVNEYKRLKPRGLIKEVYVQKWLQTYKPAVLPPKQALMPSRDALDSLLAADIRIFDERVEQIARGSITSSNTPDGAYDAGVAYLKLNHLEKARQQFDAALRMQPSYADALNAKGVILTKQGQYDEAIAVFQQALKTEDNNGFRLNIALCYYLKGERDKADALFDEVVALGADYGDLFDFLSDAGEAQQFYELGVGHLRQKRLDNALTEFDKALEADADFGDAHNAKGVALMHRGDYGGALTHFRRASELNPGQLGYQLNIALAYYKQGDTRRAGALYQQVVSLDSAYDGLFDFLDTSAATDVQYRIAVAFMQQGQENSALEKLDEIIRDNPRYIDAFNAKGVVLTRQGHYGAAFELFDQASRMVVANAGIDLNKAIVRYKQGRQDEARALYARVVANDSRYEGLLEFLVEGVGEGAGGGVVDPVVALERYRLASTYMGQGLNGRALVALDEALAADPGMVDALNAKGVVLTRQGKYDAAFALFAKALEQSPDNQGFRLNQAIALYLQGRRSQAEGLYRQVIAADQRYEGLIDELSSAPDPAAARDSYRLAAAYMGQGQDSRALVALAEALAADPDMADALNAKGVVLTRQGKYDEALEQFIRAQVVLPDHAGISLNMAIALYLKGDRNQATALYRRVIDGDGRYAGYLPFLDAP
jgi:tetratricopeptide (TPR) repeat protein